MREKEDEGERKMMRESHGERDRERVIVASFLWLCLCLKYKKYAFSATGCLSTYFNISIISFRFKFS